jgi:hypothetical protein
MDCSVPSSRIDCPGFENFLWYSLGSFQDSGNKSEHGFIINFFLSA